MFWQLDIAPWPGCSSGQYHAMHLLQILITYFRFCLIYHLSKECALRRANTTPAGKTNGSLQNLSPSGNTLITFQYSILGLSSFGSSGGSSRVTSAPPKLTQVPDVTQQQEQQQQKQISHHSNVSNDVCRIRFSWRVSRVDGILLLKSSLLYCEEINEITFNRQSMKCNQILNVKFLHSNIVRSDSLLEVKRLSVDRKNHGSALHLFYFLFLILKIELNGSFNATAINIMLGSNKTKYFRLRCYVIVWLLSESFLNALWVIKMKIECSYTLCAEHRHTHRQTRS